MNGEQTRVAELTSYVYDQVLAGRRNVLEHVLDDDFIEGGTFGLADREDWLAQMLDRTTWESIDIHDVAAVMDFSEAVITSAHVNARGCRNGEQFKGDWRVIDVWHRTGVDWRLLTRTVLQFQ